MIGIIFALTEVVICGTLYNHYRKRRRQTQTANIDDDNTVHEPKPDTTEPQGIEPNEGPRPAYPYEKAALNPVINHISASEMDAPRDSRNRGSDHLPQQELDSTYHHSAKRSTVTPYTKRPIRRKSPGGEPTTNGSASLAIFSPCVFRGPQGSSGMDTYDLSQLEQGERRLQEKIARLDRLGMLKNQRDGVRQTIQNLNQGLGNFHS